MRSLGKETREKLKKILTSTCVGIAESMGAKCEVRIRESYPGITNDNKMTAFLQNCAENILGSALSYASAQADRQQAETALAHHCPSSVPCRQPRLLCSSFLFSQKMVVHHSFLQLSYGVVANKLLEQSISEVERCAWTLSSGDIAVNGA